MGLLSLLSLILAGCQPAPEQTAPQEAGFPRDSLVVAWRDDVESLVSVVPQTSADSEITGLLNPLMVEVGFDCGLDFSPFIASSWQFSPDGRSLAVTLRDDIQWSDGRPVTARDVAFTYELAADPAVGSPRAAFLERMDFFLC